MGITITMDPVSENSMSKKLEKKAKMRMEAYAAAMNNMENPMESDTEGALKNVQQYNEVWDIYIAKLVGNGEFNTAKKKLKELERMPDIRPEVFRTMCSVIAQMEKDIAN